MVTLLVITSQQLAELFPCGLCVQAGLPFIWQGWVLEDWEDGFLGWWCVCWASMRTWAQVPRTHGTERSLPRSAHLSPTQGGTEVTGFLAHWPPNLARKWALDSARVSASKTKVESTRGWCMVLSTGYTYMYTHISTWHAWKHTCTNTYELLHAHIHTHTDTHIHSYTHAQAWIV